MNKWLSSFLTEIPKDRTDKDDILHEQATMSVMSAPSGNVSPGISPSRNGSLSLPSCPGTGYCGQCGGGYWIRLSHEASYQCGRCFPSEARIETLLIPGGTAIPKPKGQSPRPEGTVIEAAAPNAKPLYWEAGDGRILGPATPECLARSGAQFWIVTTFDGQTRWIDADLLRSRKAFSEQVAVRKAEIVREDHR